MNSRPENMQSERLNYQEICREDLDFFYRVYSDEKVMYYAYLDAVSSIEEAKKWLDELLEDTGKMYLVQNKTSKQKIGFVEYIVDQEEDTFEIAYFLLPDYWGNGYGFEMAKWLMDYVFKNMSFKKAIATCHESNGKSEHLMKKLGLSFERRQKEVRYKHGVYVDELRYKVDKESYMQR